MKRTALKVKRPGHFLRRTPLKRYTSLKYGFSTKIVPNRTCTGIKKVSRHQARINYRWSKTVKICKVRCGGICEVRGPEFLFTYGITPHHVIPRARGGCHSVFNTIMGCASCHDHGKYKDGIPLQISEALELVRRLNEEAGIEAG